MVGLGLGLIALGLSFLLAYNRVGRDRTRPTQRAGKGVWSFDVSPEWAELVTSGDVPSQHTSEQW